jgi:hypothetical protein
VSKMISLSLISVLRCVASWTTLEKTRNSKNKTARCGCKRAVVGNHSRVTRLARAGHPVVARRKRISCDAM